MDVASIMQGAGPVVETVVNGAPKIIDSVGELIHPKLKKARLDAEFMKARPRPNADIKIIDVSTLF